MFSSYLQEVGCWFVAEGGAILQKLLENCRGRECGHMAGVGPCGRGGPFGSIWQDLGGCRRMWQGVGESLWLRITIIQYQY